MNYINKLENGLTIAVEQLPAETVTLGLFVRCGSAGENQANNGMSHFIEHMCFKGTARRSYKDIAVEMDAVGGQLNAVTTREYTCYYAKVRRQHMAMALDLIMDQALCSTLAEDSIVRERQVVLEEISMLEDTPEDLVYDNLYRAHFSGSSLAMPIAGYAKNVSGFGREETVNFFHAFYQPKGMVLSAVGAVDIPELERMANEYMSAAQHISVPRPKKGSMKSDPILFSEHPCDQAHICLGFPGVGRMNGERYALSVLNGIVGGGLSSRLFQKVREEAGLAYSVYSDTACYAKEGIFSLYAGVNPSNAMQCMDVIRGEVEDILSGGITSEEVSRAKEQIKGSYILERDSMSARMSALGSAVLLSGRVRSPEEILQRVDDVTLEAVNSVAKRVFDFKNMSASFVGKGVPLESAANKAEEWRKNG